MAWAWASCCLAYPVDCGGGSSGDIQEESRGKLIQRDGYVMLKNIQPPTSIDATINVLCGECTMVIEDVEFRENFDSQLNKS